MYFVDEFLKLRLHIVQNFAKEIENKKLYTSKEVIKMRLVFFRLTHYLWAMQITATS